MEELTIVAVRQRYGANTWKERIATCRSSGQTVAKWCSTNGISSKTYYRWERKLLREASQELSCTQQLQRYVETPPMNRACTTDVVAVLRVGELTCELRQGITAECHRSWDEDPCLTRSGQSMFISPVATPICEAGLTDWPRSCRAAFPSIPCHLA